MQSHPFPWPAGLLIAGCMLVSTGMLGLVVGQHGTLAILDSAVYLAGANNLLQGNGLVRQVYVEASGSVALDPITHYAPLLSATYAALLAMGIPLAVVPSVVGVVGWVVFLAGMGVLAYRLSASVQVAAWSILLTCVTSSYLRMFQYAMSEPLFLPLLVWAMVALVGLPQRQGGGFQRAAWLAGALLLLALLLLTRYVGVVLFGAVGLWWLWWRLAQRRLRPLLWELPLLGAAALPLAAWLLRNLGESGALVEETFSRELPVFTFTDGVAGFLYQTSQLVLPALRPIHEMGQAGLALGALTPLLPLLHLVVLLPALVLLGQPLWRRHQRQAGAWAPPRSPLLVVLAAYIALYLFVQPFAAFQPMDVRDSTTLLCLLQPWLLAAVADLLRQRARIFFTWYIGGNLLVLLVPLLLVGLPELVRPTPPYVVDLADRPLAVWDYRLRGVPEWLLVFPFRTTTLERHHPDLRAYLASVEGRVTVESNYLDVLFYTEAEPHPPVRATEYFLYRTYTSWLESGRCSSPPAVTVLVVLFDWDALHYGFAEDVAALEAKCPGLSFVALEHARVYRLPRSDELPPAAPGGAGP